MKNKRNVQDAIFITILILAWFILPQAAQSAEYYVDAVNGDDANPGTSDAPWKTIPYTWSAPRGGNTIAEGDTALFKNGNYGQFKEESTRESTVQRRTDWVTYKAAMGHTPVLSQIYVHNLDKWPPVELGQSYLIFDGFRVENMVRVYHTSYVQIENCVVSREISAPYEGYNAPYYPSNSNSIYLLGVHHATIADCNVYDSSNPIYIGSYSDYITISGNESHRIGEDGIKLAGHVNNIVIEDNYIHDWRKRSSGIAVHGTISGTFEVGETVIQAGTNAEGIVWVVYSTRIGVYETTAAKFDKAGGTVTGQTLGATINPVTLVDPAHTDGISFQGTDVNDITIRGNRIIGATAQGIKIENNTPGSMEDFLLENNLIYSLGQSLSITSITNLRLINNTFMDDPSNGIQGARFSCSKGDTTITEMYNNIIDTFHQFGDSGLYTNRVFSHGNNIFGRVTVGGPTYPFALNSTEAVSSNFNALFTNAAGNDLTLAAGSTAINFGNPDYGPSTDILGNTRDALPDAGAYEYISSTPPPPPPPPPPPILYGDISGDRVVNLSDALMAAQSSLGLITLTSEQITKGDVSGDGKVSAYDAALILQKIAGIISKFPKE